MLSNQPFLPWKFLYLCFFYLCSPLCFFFVCFVFFASLSKCLCNTQLFTKYLNTLVLEGEESLVLKVHTERVGQKTELTMNRIVYVSFELGNASMKGTELSHTFIEVNSSFFFFFFFLISQPIGQIPSKSANSEIDPRRQKMFSFSTLLVVN